MLQACGYTLPNDAAVDSDDRWLQSYQTLELVDPGPLKVRFGTGPIEGTAWTIGADGAPPLYHFMPIGTVHEGRKTYYVDVWRADGREIGHEAVVAAGRAAKGYCEKNNLKLLNSDFFNVIKLDRGLRFIELCVPQGVELPPYYQEGDRS